MDRISQTEYYSMYPIHDIFDTSLTGRRVNDMYRMSKNPHNERAVRSSQGLISGGRIYVMLAAGERSVFDIIVK